MVTTTKGAHETSPSSKNDNTVDTAETASVPQHDKDSNDALNDCWTFWFDNPRMAPPGSDWKKTLKEVGSFSTVASFWGIFNNLKPTDSIASNSNYSLFRQGIEPSWEDQSNCDGGKFVLTLPKKESRSGKIDEWWLFTVLAMIGETMDDTGDQVNGAVVSVRKNQDRLALWIKTTDRDACTIIGERWKKVLRLDEKMTIRYQTHRDAAATGHSFRNEVQFQV